MAEKAKNSSTKKLSKPAQSLLAVAAVWFLLWLCFGMTINFRIPAWEYELARERWEASNISDYEMKFMFFGNVLYNGISIVVEDNKIVSMLDLGRPLDDYAIPTPIDLSQEPSWLTDPYSYGSFFPASFQYFEVNRFFEFTEEAILPIVRYEFVSFCSTNLRYEVAFNQQYGFVEEIKSTSCSSHGLLCPTISDCQAGFRVIEFVP
jgi:hypothetical protein